MKTWKRPSELHIDRSCVWNEKEGGEGGEGGADGRIVRC